MNRFSRSVPAYQKEQEQRKTQVCAARDEAIRLGTFKRGSLASLADGMCMKCEGLGVVFAGYGFGHPILCNCVFRGVFRKCFYQWQHAVSFQWSNIRHEEIDFAIDFEKIAVNRLTSIPAHVFRLHFLQGAPWKLCCQQMRISRGEFFHEVYRLEQRLGRVFVEMKPYGLYPIQKYLAKNPPPEGLLSSIN